VALLDGHGGAIVGLSYGVVVDLARSADLLVNLSGHLTQPLLGLFRRKAYVDLDPGFTQLWQASGNDGARLAGHDVYFTIGENVGTTACPIPTGGVRWHPIRPPLVLERWPVAPATSPERFTTVASWRGPFGPLQLGGNTLGLKVHEFRRFLDVPRRAPQRFEIALDVHPADAADVEALRQHGWTVVDPQARVPDPMAFRSYVQGSAAEFSAAQGVYVATNSGWFSDRTAAYLASGKPALVQDTGISRNYPTGDGLVTFRTLAEALAGVEDVSSRYGRHCRAARSLAEEYFDSDKVLARFLDVAAG
jgi:hypothetical protein